MNNKELIASVAVANDLSLSLTKNVIKSITETIIEQLKNGEEVSMSGFGTFKVIERLQRKGRNPKTGEEVIIPPSRTVKFKSGKTLKDSLVK